MNELTVFQDDLVIVFQDNAVTTSLRVAEVFEKRHNNVLKAIENLVVGLLKNEQTPPRCFLNQHLSGGAR